MANIFLRGFGYLTVRELMVILEIQFLREEIKEDEVVDEFSAVITRGNLLANIGDFVAIRESRQNRNIKFSITN